MRFHFSGDTTHTRDRRPPLTLLVAWTLALFLSAGAAFAFDFRLETENDFLTGDNEDDLYTFAVALEVEHRGSLWSLREQAFTDREAGVRFDETQLAVGRELNYFGPWNAYGEIGAVRLGEGLFGEEAQNALHSLIGDEEVDLDYVAEGDLYGSVFLRLDRLFRIGRELTAGPRLEAFAAPGFRSSALAGVQMQWSGWSFLDVEALLGARFAHSSLDVLSPHLESAELAARLALVIRDRLLVTWSYNKHGTGREHFALGYRFGAGDSAEGSGASAKR
ncbi:MAG: hypothetical protein AAF725_15555 [Acidobacteriota bacterium]